MANLKGKDGDGLDAYIAATGAGTDGDPLILQREVTASALPTGAATSAKQDSAATLTGAVNETAPASDTASSGLNGRLQRIAQRLSSLIALLPTSLGAGGGLKVDGSGTALPVSMATNTPVGNVASGATDSGNPIKVGGKYNATPPTLTDGQRGDLQVDENGNAKVVLAAGEVWNFTNGASSNGDNVKASAGYVQSVTATNANASTRYLQIHNKATDAVDTDVPALSFAIKPGESVTIGKDYFGEQGQPFDTGISVAISTTINTLTLATASDHIWSAGWV